MNQTAGISKQSGALFTTVQRRRIVFVLILYSFPRMQ